MSGPGSGVPGIIEMQFPQTVTEKPFKAVKVLPEGDLDLKVLHMKVPYLQD